MTRGGRRFTTSDVRAMLRLCDDLHTAAADSAARKERLLDGLCALVGATAGQLLVVDVGRRGASPVALAMARTGSCGRAARSARKAVVPRRVDGVPPVATAARAWALDVIPEVDGNGDGCGGTFRGRGGRFGVGTKSSGHCLRSCVPLASGKRLRACLTLQRRRPARPFSARDHEIVDVLHSSLSWVYQADVLLASPELLDLSPRQRETLQHLLTGQSEKQIAAKLQLSRNTVHHYVKALHRHFGVSSRSELLARWVGR